MSKNRVPAKVLLTQGRGADARAILKTDEVDDLPVPASLVTSGTGYSLDELAGKKVVAIVDDAGDVESFERP